MRVKSIVLAVFAAALLSIPAWAHHSHANYNLNEFVNLTGIITQVAWTNPHTWVSLEVTDAQGRKQMWSLEGGSPTSLMRGGWQRDSLKVGDKVSVRCNRVRDGSQGCLLGFFTNVNGTAMDKEFD